MKKIDAPEKIIFICDGSACGDHNKSLRKKIKELIKDAGLKSEVGIVKMGCTDNCKQAPILCIQPANKWFAEVSEQKIKTLFEAFISH